MFDPKGRPVPLYTPETIRYNKARAALIRARDKDAEKQRAARASAEALRAAAAEFRSAAEAAGVYVRDFIRDLEGL
jgi:hypothetical protein